MRTTHYSLCSKRFLKPGKCQLDFFCQGSTPFIRQIRNRFKVVARVCDQGATNYATINSLLRATNDTCIKRSVENRYLGYLVDNDEIIHFYDFPHITKGIRNGLLDLHYTVEGVTQIASWDHIKTIYEMVTKRGRFSRFVKLTDEHIFPPQIKK